MHRIVFFAFALTACEVTLEKEPDPFVAAPVTVEEAPDGRDDACSVRVDRWKELLVVEPSALRAHGSPFRFAWLGDAELVAIVIRSDLRTEERGCEGQAGELRFVYDTREASKKTWSIEVPLPRTRSARAWLEAWHALSALPFGPRYDEALKKLTTEVLEEVSPEDFLVRTNEELDGDASRWALREWAITEDPYGTVLAPVPTDGTCASCHGPDPDSAFRHLASGGMGYGRAPSTRISRWLGEELDRREQSLVRALCGSCGAPGAYGPAEPFGSEPDSW